MGESIVLRTVDIEKSFGGTYALKKVNFELKKGEILGLIGENGAGKSTLIKIIAGHYRKDSGKIYINGEKAEIHTPHDSLKLGIRVISQEFNLMSDMTVAENIALGYYPKRAGCIVKRAEMNQRAGEILERMGIDIEPGIKLRRLSVAQQQMVEIAKALWKQPYILIMDEPTAALNDQETARLFQVLKNLKKEGVTIVFITHRMQEQFELADRITVLRNGELIATVHTDQVTPDGLVEMMVGRDIGANYTRKHATKPGQKIFEAKNITAGHQIRDVSIHVRSGEIVSVFGLLGQGQEELSSAIIGDLPLQGGGLEREGKPVHLRNPADAKRCKIGYVSDDRKKTGLFPVQSTKNNITVSALNYFSKLGCIVPSQEREGADKWITRLKVKCSSSLQKISTLSGGNQQKVMIARQLANESRFLILHLPTRGVDIGAKYDIYELLEELCAQGVGILIISLELPEVLGLSDRIYIIRDGRIVGELEGAEANDSNLMYHAIGNLKEEKRIESDESGKRKC